MNDKYTIYGISSIIAKSKNESVNDMYEDTVLFEKKTELQYHMNEFKRRYHFVPDPNKKAGEETSGGRDGYRGTITIEGKKYHVDIDVNNSTMYATTWFGKRIKCGRQACADMLAGDEIFIDKDTMKSKKAYRNNSTYHEIGHLELHGSKGSNLSAQALSELLNSIRRSYMSKYGKDHPMFRTNAAFMDALKKDPKFQETLKNYNSRSDIEKAARNATARLAMQYDKRDKCPHTTWKEAEADGYAANRTSAKTGKKMLADTYKPHLKQLDKIEKSEKDKVRADYNDTKNTYKSSVGIKNMQTASISHMIANRREDRDSKMKDVEKSVNNYRGQIDIDMGTRNKALDDKKFQNSPAFKKKSDK